VTDFSHDAGEDAFHEIQLSGKQLVFLFMATTVVSVVIFLCGVLVGRGVKTDALAASNSASAAPSGAGPVSSPASTPAATPAPVPDPPPAAADNPSLSYPAALASDKPPQDALKPAGGSKKAEAAAKSAPPAPAPTAEPEPAPATPPAAAAKVTAPPPAPATAAGSRNGWAVQVVALTDRAAAQAVVQRLTGKGYPAFLVTPQPGAPVQNFKVQVGRYGDRTEAEQIKARLKKEEQFEPWILR